MAIRREGDAYYAPNWSSEPRGDAGFRPKSIGLRGVYSRMTHSQTIEVCGTVDFGVALRGDVSFTFL